MYQGQSYVFDAVVPAVIEAGIANSFATFQEPTGQQTSDGSPARTGGDSGDGYNNVLGYIGIVCMDAPTSNARITADEKKSDLDIESDNSEHVWLAAYKPEIASHTNWRVVVTNAAGDQTIFDVLGAECDSQAKTTRVKVNVSTV